MENVMFLNDEQGSQNRDLTQDRKETCRS